MSLVIATARGRLGGIRVIDPEDPGPPEAEDTGGLNTASALDDDLLWCVASGDFPRRDRVGAYDGQPEGAAALTSDAGGSPALHSAAWSGNGWFWPTTGISLGTAYTLALRLVIDSPTVEDLEANEGDFPKVLSIPYRDEASWLVPFGWHFTLLPPTAGATSVQARLIAPVSATQRNRATSPSGFVLLDGAEHTYTVRVKANGDVDWWRDGAVIATTAWQDFAHAAPDLGDAPHLIAFAEHRRLLEEGLRGTMPAAAIWGKALSDQQIADFHANPWDLVEVAADPPVPAALHAWDDFVTLPVGEVSAVSVLANDSGTGRFVDAVTQPGGTHAGTSVAIVDDGAGVEVTIDAAETAEAFDFEYTAKAPGDQESTATVHVEVFHPPPLGVDNSETLAAGATHTISPLANDNAPEGSTIQSVQGLTGAVSGTSVAVNADDVRVDVTIAEAQSAAFSFTYTADGPGVNPWTQTVTVTIAAAGPGPEPGENPNLPYFGRFYGAGAGPGHGVGQINLTATAGSSHGGNAFFFWAERSEPIDRLMFHFRMNNSAIYSNGNWGTYRFRIVEANPNTKAPISGSPVFSERTGLSPASFLGLNPNSFVGMRNVHIDFTSVNHPLEAKKAYCLLVTNTHSNPSSNYLATNHDCQWLYDHDSNQPGHDPGFFNPARIVIDGLPLPFWPFPTGSTGSHYRFRRIGPALINVRYANSGIWGGPGGQWGSGGDAYLFSISGNTRIRERFRVTRASRVVDGVFIYIWREQTSGGNLVVRLEQGPSSDTSGNGTLVEQVSVPLSQIYNTNKNGFVRHQWQHANPDRLEHLWVPFSQNRTLQLGQLYNASVHSTGGALRMRIGTRVEAQGLSPVASSWAEHEQIRTVPWTAWEDSRGTMRSTNGGSSWSFIGGTSGRRMAPIMFRCVI